MYAVQVTNAAGKVEVKQVTQDIVMAVQCLKAYPEQFAVIVRLDEDSTLRLSRVSTDILKQLSKLSIKVVLV